MVNAKKFYNTTDPEKGHFASVLRGPITKLAKRFKMDDSQVTECKKWFATTFDELGMNVTAAEKLTNLLVGYLIKNPSKEEISENEKLAKRRIQEVHGKDADKRIEKARAFIAKNPALHALLHVSGAGNHADTVLSLIEHIVRIEEKKEK